MNIKYRSILSLVCIKLKQTNQLYYRLCVDATTKITTKINRPIHPTRGRVRYRVIHRHIELVSVMFNQQFQDQLTITNISNDLYLKQIYKN
ncbi:hypothetical protein BLOT_009094 [Blomia tropicalis]|nr:hypothetical protein BLOT_009094 [Blomia tropicalis]